MWQLWLDYCHAMAARLRYRTQPCHDSEPLITSAVAYAIADGTFALAEGTFMPVLADEAIDGLKVECQLSPDTNYYGSLMWQE